MLHNLCLDSLQARRETLHIELVELRQRRQQQELEITSIENVKLRQRFQEILDNLLSQEMQKVQEVCTFLLVLFCENELQYTILCVL